MPDRQQSEELEEQVDLEGDDDDGYCRRGQDDNGMAADPAVGGSDGDEVDKGANGDWPKDEEEKRKWEDLLAPPPHGSEVSIDGLPRDITEEALRELRDPLGEIYEVRGFFLAWYFCIASQLVTWNLMLVALCDERMNDK